MLKESSNVLKEIKKYSSKNLLANKHSEHFESIAKIWDHLNFNHLISKWSELSITGLEVRFAAFPSSSLGRGFGGCGKSCLHQSSDSESPEGYAAQFTVWWTGNWKLKSFIVDKSLKTTCNNLIGWLILYIWPSLFFYGKTKIICYCCTQNYFNISTVCIFYILIKRGSAIHFIDFCDSWDCLRQMLCVCLQITQILDKSPVWKEFRDQRHDLFITDSTIAGYLTGMYKWRMPCTGPPMISYLLCVC